MKILITGASGFLGSHTAQELCRRGHQVTAFVRKTSQVRHLKSLGIPLLKGDFPDCSSLESTLPHVDGVIHIAGLIKALTKKEFFEVNAQGVKKLVSLISKTSPKPRILLYVSTIAVHNPSHGNDFCLPSENCKPLSHYGQSKLQGELALSQLEKEISTFILRPPVLYGPRDYALLPLFKSIHRGIAPLYQRGQNQLSICYVADVARAIGDLIESNLAGRQIFCLDDGRIHTWRSLAGHISQVLEKKIRALPIPHPLFYTAATFSEAWGKITRTPQIFTRNKLKEIRQPSWVCGFQKIKDYLGWEPKINLQEGLQKTWEYYRQAGLMS